MPLISFTDKELMTIETSAARARQPGRFLRDVANALKGHYVIRPRNSRAVAVAIQRQCTTQVQAPLVQIADYSC